MKKLTLLFLIVVSCTKKKITNETTKENGISFQLAAAGMIDNKHRIDAKFECKNGILSGEYSYDSFKTSMTIEGTVSIDSIIYFKEKNPKGKEIAEFNGKFLGNSISGNWNKINIKDKKITFEVSDEKYKCNPSIKSNVILDSNFIIPRIISNDKKIESLINKNFEFEKCAGYTLDELKIELEERKNEQSMIGLANVSFEIIQNAYCLISTEIYTEYIGAYSTISYNYINVDASTGKQIEIKDLIKDVNSKQLLKLCNEKLQANIEEARSQHKSELDDEIELMYANNEFKSSDLARFYIRNGEIIFCYLFDFPHVMLALEPNNYITLTNNEIQPFLIKKQYGL